ncbi:ATP-dependent helicase [Levyella massiliensis]|uniref:ATP-dependent helicase n=1 Tax=Levyella massiliensis TaxID=938289 RepID=UPI0003815EAE|nr:UvrD-helicase domain-containing protein [Levyella massiliensis]
MQYENLNRAQQEVVLSDDPALLVLAGAGSGKTRVLTTKIVRLVEEKGTDPRHILAFTFTNKAAAEMRERVEKALGEEPRGMWIGTFHSMCARLLRRDIACLGYSSDFTIYDTQDQRTLVKQILKDMQGTRDMRPQTVLARISDYKNRSVSVDAVLQSAQMEREKIIAHAYRRYEETKKKNNALDFDDLILKAIEVLKQDEVRAHYQEKFQYIFVDEYQDTNHPQYELIRLLTGKQASICVVGDADQSIYGWRGADIHNILSFERDFPGARTILLEQNYRSTSHILNAANQLIAHNRERKDKNLWTANGEGEAVHFRRVQSEHEEAALVASQIRQEEKNGVALAHMAVLYRTNAQSRPFEEAFLREGLPYRVIGGLKFYDRAEIKDLVAYMNLILNPLDDVSFTRIVNQPKRGIGETTLARLREEAASAGMSLLQAVEEEEILSNLTVTQRNKLMQFGDLIQELNREREDMKITQWVEHVYERSGYRDMLESSHAIEDQSRIENVGSFLDAVSVYEEEEEEPSLVNYLQSLSLLSDLDKTENKENGVNLLTIHSAKGLEFEVVFVVGLEEGLFPSRRSMEEGNLEEERRLLYVAMTRAMKHLYLSQAQSRRVFGTPMAALPSSFLEELEGSIETEDMPSVLTRSNVYDRNYAPRSNAADPRLRAEYDRKREAFRTMIREKQKQRDAELSTSLRVGDKVQHKKFGHGTVIAVVPQENGDEVTVAFEGRGIKRLNATLAPMKKL